MATYSEDHILFLIVMYTQAQEVYPNLHVYMEILRPL